MTGELLYGGTASFTIGPKERFYVAVNRMSGPQGRCLHFVLAIGRAYYPVGGELLILAQNNGVVQACESLRQR